METLHCDNNKQQPKPKDVRMYMYVAQIRTGDSLSFVNRLTVGTGKSGKFIATIKYKIYLSTITLSTIRKLPCISVRFEFTSESVLLVSVISLFLQSQYHQLQFTRSWAQMACHVSLLFPFGSNYISTVHHQLARSLGSLSN